MSSGVMLKAKMHVSYIPIPILVSIDHLQIFTFQDVLSMLFSKLYKINGLHLSRCCMSVIAHILCINYIRSVHCYYRIILRI